MTVIEIAKNFSDNRECLSFLEKTRWGDKVRCPYCNSDKTGKKSEKRQQDRYQCQECRKSFTATVGTIFHKARKLPEWFLVLALMSNAKKGLSSYRVARDTGIRQATAWNIMTKIGKAMETKESRLLKGIVEMDETYIGGRPRKDNNKKSNGKRGRGTNKTAVLGTMERNGEVKTKVVAKSDKLSYETLSGILKRNVDPIKTRLIADEYRGYSPMGSIVDRSVVNRQATYCNGTIHINTLEGFWSLIKRAWYGSHRHYDRENVHSYVAETSYKYNNRKNRNIFLDTVIRMLGTGQLKDAPCMQNQSSATRNIR